jgi:hypothetical protein
MRRLMAAAALALLTSGCATYSWYRADTPLDLAERDRAECQQLARDSARDIAASALPRFYGPVGPWPYGGRWAWGRMDWPDSFWGPANDPFVQMDAEQRIAQRCMEGRGYELRRVPDTAATQPR